VSIPELSQPAYIKKNYYVKSEPSRSKLEGIALQRLKPAHFLKTYFKIVLIEIGL
jgi:hypothetical protein